MKFTIDPSRWPKFNKLRCLEADVSNAFASGKKTFVRTGIPIEFQKDEQGTYTVTVRSMSHTKNNIHDLFCWLASTFPLKTLKSLLSNYTTKHSDLLTTLKDDIKSDNNVSILITYLEAFFKSYPFDKAMSKLTDANDLVLEAFIGKKPTLSVFLNNIRSRHMIAVVELLIQRIPELKRAIKVGLHDFEIVSRVFADGTGCLSRESSFFIQNNVHNTWMCNNRVQMTDWMMKDPVERLQNHVKHKQFVAKFKNTIKHELKKPYDYNVISGFSYGGLVVHDTVEELVRELDQSNAPDAHYHRMILKSNTTVYTYGSVHISQHVKELANVFNDFRTYMSIGDVVLDHNKLKEPETWAEDEAVKLQRQGKHKLFWLNLSHVNKKNVIHRLIKKIHPRFATHKNAYDFIFPNQFLSPSASQTPKTPSATAHPPVSNSKPALTPLNPTFYRGVQLPHTMVQ
jgi:hypothetical protein